MIDHNDSFDCSNIVESVTVILEANPGCRVFLFKETESTNLSTSHVEFDVIHALIVLENKSPPECVQFKTVGGLEPIQPFSFLHLEWVNICKLTCDSDVAPLGEGKFFPPMQGSQCLE